MPSVQKEITAAISLMEYGNVFSVHDLVLYGSYDTVKRTLHRITDSGQIQRVLNGLYYKPSPYQDFPRMSNIAEALARKFSWDLAPSKEHCLFLMGLGEKDDDGCSFLSSGPGRSYDILGRTLTFRHTQSKDISGLSAKSQVAVQALRAVGKDNINARTLSIMKRHITESEMEMMRRECTAVTGWIYDAIISLVSLA